MDLVRDTLPKCISNPFFDVIFLSPYPPSSQEPMETSSLKNLPLACGKGWGMGSFNITYGTSQKNKNKERE